MHLKQPGFTYSACGLFTKNKERIKKFKETGDTRCIYRNELDKACFQHDMAYGDFKDLAKRTASGKVLRSKAFNIAKNLEYDDIKEVFLLCTKNRYTKNWSEEVCVTEEVKSTVPWTYVINDLINDLNGEEIIGTLYEKELQKTSQQKFRIEKVIKRKGNKLYVKLKGYDNSFHSWIDKKDVA